jgi:hypothetical protein
MGRTPLVPQLIFESATRRNERAFTIRHTIAQCLANSYTLIF